jgi:ABC-type uncharacterized transport system permease subunit
MPFMYSTNQLFTGLIFFLFALCIVVMGYYWLRTSPPPAKPIYKAPLPSQNNLTVVQVFFAVFFAILAAALVIALVAHVLDWASKL